METNNFQTSFIPKQTLVENPVSRRQPISLVSTLALVVLIASILLAGGAYAYQYWLDYEINRECPDPAQNVTSGCGLIASLNKEKQALDEGLLTEFKRLAAKLDLANKLISKHVTVLPIMDLLSELTLESVRFTSFDYDGKNITISGVAKSYEDVAVQSNVFDREKLISGFLFSDLNLDTAGNVVFKLVLTVDPRLLSYELSTR